MKISINWLKEYISLSETPQEIAALLTQSGLEVSHIASFGLFSDNLAGLVIGQVIACKQHPNADRLYCTQVDIGADRPLAIVCGAPNVRVGQKVAVALIGSTLHTYTGERITIKATKIRGELSEGMLCAEDEIGLGPSHEEILSLHTDLPPGTPLNKYFNVQEDTILTIELTPNRIDACSHLGIARELRALLDRPIQYPALLPQLKAYKASLPIQVTVQAPEACPRYAGIVIKDIAIRPSPPWLQQKLMAIGLQPINNIVDITNLVMYELGQPLHAFDYDQITDKQIQIRYAKEGEQLLTLDQIDRTLTGQELVIADQVHPIALAGILGGKSTGVTIQTKHIFLESAYFSPQVIRTTVAYHKLKTDAAFRYERGTDPNLPIIALQRACLLILEIAGGELASELIDLYPHPIQPLYVEVNYTNIEKLVGQHIPRTTIQNILHNLDIVIQSEEGDKLTAIVPPYRVDITREVDIIEEILRIYGYDNIQAPTHLHSTFLAPTSHPRPYQLIQQLSPLLVANGYQEICTNSLTASSTEIEATPSQERLTPIYLLNPLSERLNQLRTTLLFAGLETIAYNINRKQFDLKLFEFGKIYYQSGQQYIESNKLGIWLTGNIEAANWIRQPRKVNFQDLNTMVHILLDKVSIQQKDVAYVPITHPNYTGGVQLYYHDKPFATLVQVEDPLLQHVGIQQPVFFADIDITQLSLYPIPALQYQPISKFPLVKRDLSLVIDQHILFEDIKKVVLSQEERLIQDMHVFDVYQGTQLPPGKKAYAISFFLQDKDKTLNEKTIQHVMTQLIHAFQEKLGAIIRE